MSQDEPAQSSRKDKRAKRDAERAEKFKSKGKKRKASEVVDDGAEPEDIQQDDIDQDVIALAQDGADAPVDEPRKRRRKEAHQSAAKPDTTIAQDTNPEAQELGKAENNDPDSKASETKSKQRFIVFCGNLPYTSTDASLQQHFVKLQPFTLRHRTDPKTKKSKGFAFLEFDNYDRMKTCLKLYHHSYYDPEGGPEPEEDSSNRRNKKRSKGRRINVELTAGGGGGTEARKEKIKVKNVRLEEQRRRRAEAEAKEKTRNKGQGADGKGNKSQTNKPAKDVSAVATSGQQNGMHPSRLANLQR